MVAELVERGSFDAMDDLARALPLAVVVDLIGVKGDVREHFLTWGQHAQDCLGPMNERAARGFEIAGEFFGWVSGITAADLEEGSMGHGIFLAAERGEIPHESCGALIHQYIAAGMDTTIAALSNAGHASGHDAGDLLRAPPGIGRWSSYTTQHWPAPEWKIERNQMLELLTDSWGSLLGA